MMKIEITNSEFSEAFKDSPISESIFLNNKENSKELWNRYIDADNSTSYFNLADKNWIVSSEEVNLTQWIKAYNDGDLTLVKGILKEKLNWQQEDVILFFISSFFVIETTWEIFLNSWISFLECDDECPILINTSNKEKEAILFKPLGNVSLIRAKL